VVIYQVLTYTYNCKMYNYMLVVGYIKLMSLQFTLKIVNITIVLV